MTICGESSHFLFFGISGSFRRRRSTFPVANDCECVCWLRSQHSMVVFASGVVVVRKPSPISSSSGLLCKHFKLPNALLPVFCVNFGDCVDVTVAICRDLSKSFTSVSSDASLFDVGESSSSKLGTILQNQQEYNSLGTFNTRTNNTRCNAMHATIACICAHSNVISHCYEFFNRLPIQGWIEWSMKGKKITLHVLWPTLKMNNRWKIICLRIRTLLQWKRESTTAIRYAMHSHHVLTFHFIDYSVWISYVFREKKKANRPIRTTRNILQIQFVVIIFAIYF